jgi:uncharacterized protein YciI
MADTDRTYLLLYDYVEDMLERRTPHREAHLARVQSQRDAGNIVMAGAFGDPPIGAALVWRGVEPDAIEAFVNDDPYNQAGLITAWRVEPWAVR